MGQLLAVDFGSTFTKVRAIDSSDGALIASGQASTTLETGVMDGLYAALRSMRVPTNLGSFEDCLATSSAAGGLRIVAIGLVADLTAEAARRAALGAGGKIVATFAGELSRSDRSEILRLAPDLVVLSGGTDGGERTCITANARFLSEMNMSAALVIAGNYSARDEIEDIFKGTVQDFEIVANVLPAVRELNIAPCSEAIRRAFITRIVHAKGINVAEDEFGRVVMPTPRAVLDGCVLLANGGKEEAGLGDLVCFDVGGATTDVYSIGTGSPSEGQTVQRGLPEPFAKRTVEGDLGVRVSAADVVMAADRERIELDPNYAGGDVSEYAEFVSINTSYLPLSTEERILDRALARAAIRIAARRHAGRLETSFDPHGRSYVQYGKDLRPIRTVIGTGGILSASDSDAARRICQVARWDDKEPDRLLPKDPTVVIDHNYILFAAGLLAVKYPDAAIKLLRRSFEAGRDAVSE